jgi:Domain of unknown function (DUF6484)
MMDRVATTSLATADVFVADESGVIPDRLADLAEAASAAPSRRDGPVVGLLWGLGVNGEPLVRFAGEPGDRPVPARSVVPLDPSAVGREVVLLFEGNDPARPLVMGVIAARHGQPVCTEIDGEKLVLSADREVVLRCGEASITLTRAGKVLIEGAYVVTKSSGLNRIKGAAVQIN